MATALTIELRRCAVGPAADWGASGAPKGLTCERGSRRPQGAADEDPEEGAFAAWLAELTQRPQMALEDAPAAGAADAGGAAAAAEAAAPEVCDT